MGAVEVCGANFRNILEPIKLVGDLKWFFFCITYPGDYERFLSALPLLYLQPTDSTVQQRSRMPQNMHETQLELTLAAEMGEQRRVAAITSRARSRIISRAEGTSEGGQLDYHTNVAEAAAEQLRRLEQASGKKVRKEKLPFWWRVKPCCE